MPYDIIPMWNIKANKRQQKSEQSKLNKNKHRYRGESSGYQRERVRCARAGEMG